MRRKLWLCLPPVLFCVADVVVTLAEQPPAYWAGSFADAHEGAPQGEWLLRLHPLAYVAAAVLYVAVIVLLVLALPRLLARATAAAFLLGHAWGISTWVEADRPDDGYWIVVALFVIAAGLLVISLELSDAPRPVPAEPPAEAPRKGPAP
jgi:hypothetical protein